MKYFLVFVVILFSTFYILFSGFASAEVLPTPTIAVYPDVYYPFDEVLYLEGSAKQASVIQLQLTKQGARPETFSVKSDGRGEWVFAEKIPLASGEWEARARIAEGGGVRGTGFRLV